jgi:hypothetical protein
VLDKNIRRLKLGNVVLAFCGFFSGFNRLQFVRETHDLQAYFHQAPDILFYKCNPGNEILPLFSQNSRVRQGSDKADPEVQHYRVSF